MVVSRIWLGALVAGLVMMPAVFWPGAEIPFEIPRVEFVLRWIEVMGILTLLMGAVLRFEKLDGKLLAVMLGFGAIAGMASVTGVDLAKSVWGNVYRGDGWITLLHLIGLSLVVMLAYEGKWRKLVVLGISGGSLLVSGWAVVEGLRLHLFKVVSIPNWQGAMGVSFGNPNFLAGYLLVTWPFGWYLVKRVKLSAKWLVILGIVVQGAAIMLTRSWAGILGMMVVLCGYAAMRVKKRQWWLMALAAGILLGGGLWWWQRFESLGFVPQSRERIFRKILMGVAKRPILGWGWGNVDYAFESGEWPMKFEQDVYVDKAHSTVLEVVATTGVVGLIVYLVMLVAVGKILWQRLKLARGEKREWVATLLLVLGIYLFHSQTNVTSVGEEVIFWLVVGLAEKS